MVTELSQLLYSALAWLRRLRVTAPSAVGTGFGAMSPAVAQTVAAVQPATAAATVVKSRATKVAYRRRGETRRRPGFPLL